MRYGRRIDKIRTGAIGYNRHIAAINLLKRYMYARVRIKEKIVYL